MLFSKCFSIICWKKENKYFICLATFLIVHLCPTSEVLWFRIRFLHVILYTAERAWSHAMEKRQLPNGPNARQRIYLIGRLRKAVKWATLFSLLCAVKADSRTSLEAEVCLLFPHLIMASLLQYFVPPSPGAVFFTIHCFREDKLASISSVYISFIYGTIFFYLYFLFDF